MQNLTYGPIADFSSSSGKPSSPATWPFSIYWSLHRPRQELVHRQLRPGPGWQMDKGPSVPGRGIQMDDLEPCCSTLSIGKRCCCRQCKTFRWNRWMEYSTIIGEWNYGCGVLLYRQNGDRYQRILPQFHRQCLRSTSLCQVEHFY